MLDLCIYLFVYISISLSTYLPILGIDFLENS